jgi:hypothetical protein
MLKLVINSTEFECLASLLAHDMSPVQINEITVAMQKSIQVSITILGTSPANIGSQMTALENLLGTGNQVSNVAFNDGTGNVAHSITSGSTLTGITPSNFRWTGDPGHLAYTAIANVTLSYLVGVMRDETLEWKETIDIQGEDGAVTVLAPQATAQSTRQETSQNIHQVVVTQQGMITGRTGFPSMPSPKITTAGAKQVGQTKDKKQYNQRRTAVLGFIRTYSYTFTLPSHPGNIVPNFLI